jgi:hypothetical protein
MKPAWILVPMVAGLLGASPARAQERNARLLGVYDRMSGDAIEGAQVVDLLTKSFATTLADGTASLAFVRTQHDSAVVWVRKLGYRDTSFVLKMGAADTIGMILLLDRVVALPAIVTTAKYRLDEDPGKWEGFEQRCGVNHVSCFREPELADHPAARISDMLLRAPDGGVKRTCRNSIANCTVSVGGCPPNYFLDGFLFLPGPSGHSGSLAQLENFIGPKEIKGMEVYRPELTPQKFSRGVGTCAVVVWTK